MGDIEMTSYGDIIKQGRTENSKAHSSGRMTEAVNTDTDHKPTPDNKPVNITIKVPRKSRQYWTSQCKLEGLTMTEVLVQALTERFGEPK